MITTPSFTVRVCAHCENEFGDVAIESHQQKSHGICRRHFIATIRAAGLPEAALQASLAKKSPDAFCPDLREELNCQCI